VGDVSFAAALFLLALACAALYWRRSQPLAVLCVTVIATALAAGIGYSELAGGYAMLIALYSVGRHASSDLWSYIGLGGALGALGFDYLLGELTAAAVGFGIVVLSMGWYIGKRVRMRAERAAQLEREQAADAQRAVAEERTRIARELHDVVAHRVSLMTVQAGAAKTVAGDDPQAALAAMEAVEHAGREALDELRHLLGVLRPKADGGALGPQPGLADVARLVDQFREAGLDVSLTMSDVPTDLPARVDLSAYRIVQEALTNVLKHAGPGARSEVRLGIDNDAVSIEITDDGHAATSLPGSGHGIMGMRERAVLLDGSLTAGHLPDGGFRVLARLPIGGRPA
jgi:signal transduction histidine kinase